jgi:ABC-type amino acid transport substrate-binding protein
MAATTRPYYRSTYVFVWRADRSAPARSLDDPALRRLRIGVQLAGDDYANTPPSHALSARGILANVVGFTLYGDYSEPNPPARILDAVADGTIDVAIVWGPLAGYFARREKVPLSLRPVPVPPGETVLPMAFDIAVGVRRGNETLRGAIDAVLERRREAIRKVLDAYGVPRAPGDRP